MSHADHPEDAVHPRRHVGLVVAALGTIVGLLAVTRFLFVAALVAASVYAIFAMGAVSLDELLRSAGG